MAQCGCERARRNVLQTAARSQQLCLKLLLIRLVKPSRWRQNRSARYGMSRWHLPQNVSGTNQWGSFSQLWSDGSMLASGGHDALLRLWDWQQETCSKALPGHTSWIWAFHPNGQMVASGSDQTVRLWDVQMVSAKHCRDIRVWFARSVSAPMDTPLQVAAVIKPCGSGICKMACLRTLQDIRVGFGQSRLADGHTLAVAAVIKPCGYGMCRSCLKILQDIRVGLGGLADGHTLAVAAMIKTVRLWDVQDRNGSSNVTIIPVGFGLLLSAPNGRLLASSGGQTIRCGMSGAPARKKVLQGTLVWSVQFSLVRLTLACHPVQVDFGQW